MVSTGNDTCKLGMFSVISAFLTKYHHDTCNTFVSLIVNINFFVQNLYGLVILSDLSTMRNMEGKWILRRAGEFCQVTCQKVKLTHC